ncbi:fungal-specific transcription factor domain-containing protein [Fusarium solani]|uniref:Fungal-specific transcription factor domain-containing protein n=1 Tax=Fusarium solani TaxID=169388 RepID=A0A9P9GH93_FUSSL|nr:fungal-specific transcription factor domain-containing protein [Fusarium solani]KAH7237922.1 fungal-specific transcription factor domain-containing protein [Fusarium solani]
MSFPDIVWQSTFDSVCGALAADAGNILAQGPRPKRRKTQLACNCCRVRKTKCDGGRPVCYACEKRGSRNDCLYEEGSLKTRKLEQLEKGHDHGQTRLQDGSEHIGSRPDVLLWSTTRAARRQSTLSVESPSQAGSPDALATVSTCVDHRNVLYGASSTIAFVQHVLLTTGETDDVSQPSQDDGRLATHTIWQPGPQAERLEGLDLIPIRRISDRYLQSFWDIVHPVFPILHRPTFIRFYGELWEPTSSGNTNTTVDDPVILATLNLVLAIGCRFTQCVDLGSRALQADQLYQRARALVPIDCLDVASLPVVQLLLLTAVHLQSTMYPSRCWNMVGLAMRVAQSLGLHLNEKSAERNQLEREMRRRIWYTCATLDRLMCTTFGRPAMLSHSSLVPLPLLIDDEHLLEDREGTQPADSPCRMGLFVYTVQLLDILNEVLHCFYAEASPAQVVASNHQGGSMPDLHEMLRLNSKLDLFLETLPSHLRLQTVSTNSDAPTGSALLQARILYCRCSAWWTVYFTFGAATVVLASLRSSQEDTTTLVDNSLSLAMAIFKHYTFEVKSGAQAIQVIEVLRDRLSRVRNTGGSTPVEGTQQTDSQESEALFGNNVGDAEHCFIPDPLSEGWFSHQAMHFDFEESLKIGVNF